MTNEIPIFIISHGRADNVATVAALDNAGITDNIFIVVDDLDEQRASYEEKFGTRCIVFDKREIAKETETMDNFGIMATPVYARNYVQKYAKANGIIHYIVMDDDITKFGGKIVDKGKFKTRKINDIDPIFSSIFDFLDSSPNLTVLSLANEGGYFGGMNGEYKNGLVWKIQQVMFCDSRKHIHWNGTYNEDMNATTFPDTIGYKVMSVFCKSPSRGSNTGGISYISQYMNNYYTYMLCPAAIGKGGTIRKGNVKAEIISDRWKK